MRILLLSQWFYPENFMKGMPLLKTLQSLGHEVEVLTGFPNYPEGKIFPGYRLRLWQREVIEGIPINRVFVYPSHDASVVRRVANYLSFAWSAAILGPRLVQRPDVIHVYHPPGSIAWPARALQRRFRVPIVYDIQDLWPDTIATTGMLSHPGILKRIDKWCEWTYRFSDRIAVQSPGFRRVLTERQVPAEKISVIYNWTDEGQQAQCDYDRALAERYGLADRFNILFAGTMGKAQGLDVVLEAAARVAQINPRVQFVFVGGGIEVDRLQQIAATERLSNVKFLPRQSRQAINQLFAIADVLLVHLRDDPLFTITIPSKVQAYLCAGKPILAGLRGDAAELLERAQSGCCCAPGNPAAMAQAALDMAAMPTDVLAGMGERGRQFYEETLSVRAGTERFLALYTEAVASSTRER